MILLGGMKRKRSLKYCFYNFKKKYCWALLVIADHNQKAYLCVLMSLGECL